MSCIYFLGFHRYLYFTVSCFFCHYIVNMPFVNLLHVFKNIVNLFYILFSHSVSVNVNVGKGITHTVRVQSNTTSFELWIIFPVTLLFLLIWCKQKSYKKVKIFFYS